MRSQKLTPVAALRSTLRLSVEEFADLIGKAVSTVRSLETGRLGLSEETARTITEQTGVALSWLLNGNAKQKPYRNYTVEGAFVPYTRDYFEEVQWAKARQLIMPRLTPLAPELRLWPALDAISEWISVYYHACETGDGEFARYLMQKAIKPLIERFGKDDKAALEANKNARITLANGDEFRFQHFRDRGISLGPCSTVSGNWGAEIARKVADMVDKVPQKKRAAKT